MESSKFSRKSGIPPGIKQLAGKVQSSKRKILFAICYLLFANLIGCATIINGAKGFAGISTKALENGRKEALTKAFNYDYNTCYKETKNILARMGTYVYAQDAKKKMIAFYVSELDTTPVGVFFKEIDANNTQVEVSSPSTSVKEFIAAEVFKSLSPAEKPAEPDAQKN